MASALVDALFRDSVRTRTAASRAATCRSRRRRSARAEIAEVIATLESGWLSTGPRVAAFEQAFADYTGAPHAVALNSCTAALHLSLLAAGIGAGDEVITTPLTFCATANVDRPHRRDAGLRRHRSPTRSTSIRRHAAAAVTPRTRAILPVHFAGRPVDVAAFGAPRAGATV